MYIKAKAKINLFLHITGKRDDGYHLMQSMMAFADDIYDLIEITAAEKNSTLIEGGEFEKLLLNESHNLIDQAAALFSRNKYHQYSLSKNIPIGAGLGGGSSDAAMVTKFLNDSAPLDENINKKLTSIGADLAICYHGKAAFCSNIGETIEAIQNFPKLYLVLINPRENLLTKDVYLNNRKINTEIIKTPPSFANSKELIDFLMPLNNDLTESALELMPEIGYSLELLNSQADCCFARMSGSGPSCFGVFSNELAAKQAAYKISLLAPNYWVKHTAIS